MTLSVLCPTRDPGERVRALLEPFRGVADEIVVAVDSRVDPDLIGDHAAVADRLLRFELGPANSALSWLHEQCHGDWVLTIAGDEVASPELIAALPELVASRSVLQYWFPVRWLFPDAGLWLGELPWYPDFHNRLVRNDGTLRFPGVAHSGAAASLPARYLGVPIYHLDLIVRAEEQRRAKVERYEQAAPGLLAPGGGPLNEQYYLPERRASPRLERVPQADRTAIERVLAARPSGHPPPAPLVPRPWAEIERYWAGRPLTESAYRGRIQALEDDPVLYAGEHRALHFRIANEGDERWPWGLDQAPHIRIGHRLRRRDGGPAPWQEGARSPFPCEVRPGEACIAPVAVVAPGEPGAYELEVDLVHDPFRWFGQPLALEVIVVGGSSDSRSS